MPFFMCMSYISLPYPGSQQSSRRIPKPPSRFKRSLSPLPEAIELRDHITPYALGCIVLLLSFGEEPVPSFDGVDRVLEDDPLNGENVVLQVVLAAAGYYTGMRLTSGLSVRVRDVRRYRDS